MHVEIAQAVEFLCRLLCKTIEPELLQSFRRALTGVLTSRFESHWDTARPYWGNGYRALSSFNGVLDPALAQAAETSSIPATFILNTLPRDLVLWIDPYNVSYRIGDHGNINTLFEDKSRGRVTIRCPDTSITAPITAASLATQLQFAAAVAAYPSPTPSPRMFAPGPRAVKISPPPSPPGKAAAKILVAVN